MCAVTVHEFPLLFLFVQAQRNSYLGELTFEKANSLSGQILKNMSTCLKLGEPFYKKHDTAVRGTQREYSSKPIT